MLFLIGGCNYIYILHILLSQWSKILFLLEKIIIKQTSLRTQNQEIKTIV